MGRRLSTRLPSNDLDSSKGHRTSVSGIGYLAGALSEPPALAGGSSAAIAQLGNPKVSLPTEPFTRSDLELPAALRPAAPRSASNSHHAAHSAPANSTTVQGGPPVFTDDPLVPGVTPIKALHITQLRTVVNDARTRAALPGANWAESISSGATVIKAGYGALKRLNVSGVGRLLAVDEVQTNGTKVTSYLMGDRQGSARVLMDAVGAVTSIRGWRTAPAWTTRCGASWKRRAEGDIRRSLPTKLRS